MDYTKQTISLKPDNNREATDHRHQWKDRFWRATELQSRFRLTAYPNKHEVIRNLYAKQLSMKQEELWTQKFDLHQPFLIPTLSVSLSYRCAEHHNFAWNWPFIQVIHDRMTKECGAGLCIPNLTRHFSVILPSWVFQPSCCVSSVLLEREKGKQLHRPIKLIAKSFRAILYFSNKYG